MAQQDGDGVGCNEGLGHPGLLQPRAALAQASTFDESGIAPHSLRPEQDVAKSVAVLGNLAGALPGRLAGGGSAGRPRRERGATLRELRHRRNHRAEVKFDSAPG